MHPHVYWFSLPSGLFHRSSSSFLVRQLSANIKRYSIGFGGTAGAFALGECVGEHFTGKKNHWKNELVGAAFGGTFVAMFSACSLCESFTSPDVFAF